MNAKKASTQRRRSAKRAVPCVGIFFLVGNKLWIDSTPLDQVGRYADFLNHAFTTQMLTAQTPLGRELDASPTRTTGTLRQQLQTPTDWPQHRSKAARAFQIC